VRLLSVAGTADRVGSCDVCGFRVVLNRRPGTTDCPGCTTPYDNLTGSREDALFLRELGHSPPA
jgi:hypothetical protein